MNREILIEQILNDAKEGYLCEGFSKHAPEGFTKWHKRLSGYRGNTMVNSAAIKREDDSLLHGIYHAIFVWKNNILWSSRVAGRKKRPTANQFKEYLFGKDKDEIALELANHIYKASKDYMSRFSRIPTPEEIKKLLTAYITNDTNRYRMNKNAASKEVDADKKEESLKRLSIYKFLKSNTLNNALKIVYKKKSKSLGNRISNLFRKKNNTEYGTSALMDV